LPVFRVKSAHLQQQAARFFLETATPFGIMETIMGYRQ